MEINGQNTASPGDTNTQPQGDVSAAPAQVTDLDGLSEFTFQGQKLTPEQLMSVMNEHKSLSAEHKTYAQEKKFYENLEADLDLVLADPGKAQKFKEIYPQKFHGYLDKILRDNGQAPAPAQQNAQALPKEFMDEFGQIKQRLQFHEQRAYQAEVAAASAQLDTMLPPLFKKYEMANEEQVYARAEALVNGGHKLTEKTWERLVRESHEAIDKKAEARSAAKLKEQIEKGQRGAGEGPGGATPGQAPVKMNFDQAREAAIASLSRRG